MPPRITIHTSPWYFMANIAEVLIQQEKYHWFTTEQLREILKAISEQSNVDVVTELNDKQIMAANAMQPTVFQVRNYGVMGVPVEVRLGIGVQLRPNIKRINAWIRPSAYRQPYEKAMREVVSEFIRQHCV